MEAFVRLELEHIGVFAPETFTLNVEQETFHVYVPNATEQQRQRGQYWWSITFDIPPSVPLPKGWRGQAFRMTLTIEQVRYSGFITLWSRTGRHAGRGHLTRTGEGTPASIGGHRGEVRE